MPFLRFQQLHEDEKNTETSENEDTAVVNMFYKSKTLF